MANAPDDDDHFSKEFNSKLNINARGNKDEATSSKQEETPTKGKKASTNDGEPELPDNDNGEPQAVDYFVLISIKPPEGAPGSAKQAARVINSHMLGEDGFDPRRRTTGPRESLDAETRQWEISRNKKNIAKRRLYSGHPNVNDYHLFWKVPAEFSVAEFREKIESKTYDGVKVYMSRIVHNEIMKSTHQGTRNIHEPPDATSSDEEIDSPTGQE